MPVAQSIEDVILGEATHGTTSQRFRDMVAIASVIANRASRLGVSPEDVVSVRSEFNAYGKALPKGVERYRALARKALDYVRTAGPIHNATFYATSAAAGNLPKGLRQVSSTKGHQYFADDQNRAIRTAQGFRQPRPIDMLPSAAPVPTPRPDAGPNAPAAHGRGMAALAPNGLVGPDRMPLPSADQQAAIRSNLADVSYNMGPNRPNRPGQHVVDIVRGAVRETLGPGYSVNVISGQENAGHRHGSNRHGTGNAVDVQIHDPSGRRLSTFNREDRQKLLDVAQAANAMGAQGTGLGTNYMGGHGMHIDTVTPGRGQDHEWGNLGNANAKLLADARKFKSMPANYYDRSMPQEMTPPAARPDATGTAAPSRSNPPARPGQMPPQRSLDTAVASLGADSAPAMMAFGPMTRASASPAATGAYPAASERSSALATPGGYLSPTPPSLLASTPPARLQPSTAPAPRLEALPEPVVASRYTLGDVPQLNPSPAASTVPAGEATIAPGLTEAQRAAYEYASQTRRMAPLEPVAHPPAPPAPASPPPSLPAAPAPVLAPALAPPRLVEDRPVASLPVEPRLSAYDIHNGAIGSAQSSWGGNTVSNVGDGNRYITNQYGATTAIDPRGIMSRVSSIPGPIGDQSQSGGILGNWFKDDPATAKDESDRKRKVGLLAGGLLGSALGGPMGAAAVGLLANELAKPGAGRIGNLMKGLQAVDTSNVAGFGPTTAFYKPQSGLAFPAAPSSGGPLNPSYSGRSYAEMEKISPRAADAISRGKGGLY